MMFSVEEKGRISSAVRADRGFMKEFVEDFLNDLPADLTALDQAMVQKDASKLERAAHGLKSVVGLFQAMVCYDLVRELELMAKEADFDKAEVKLVEVKQALDELTLLLQKSL